MKLYTLGAGNMAQALIAPMAGRLEDFVAYTPSGAKALQLAKVMGGGKVSTLKEFLDLPAPDFLFLSFKPQQFSKASADFLKSGVWEQWRAKTTLVSMLAGTPLEVLEKVFSTEQVVRIMPNTPALVGKGITLITPHPKLNQVSLSQLKTLLEEAGPTFECQEEDQLDTVTAVTGSGPAYIFEYTRILQEFLIKKGISASDSRQLAVNLVYGAAELMHSQETELETLRNNVTSKNGVTEAALEEMKKQNLSGLLMDSLEKNIERSFELRQDALKMNP